MVIPLLTDRDGTTHEEAIGWFDVTIESRVRGSASRHRSSAACSFRMRGGNQDPSRSPVPARRWVCLWVPRRLRTHGPDGRGAQDSPDHINPVEPLTRSSCPLETGPVGSDWVWIAATLTRKGIRTGHPSLP